MGVSLTLVSKVTDLDRWQRQSVQCLKEKLNYCNFTTPGLLLSLIWLNSLSEVALLGFQWHLNLDPMLKVLTSFSASEFLPFLMFAVAKEMQFFGFGLELAVKLLKSPQSSSWNELLLVTAWRCSLSNYLVFDCDPTQLITPTNGCTLCVCLWLHCVRSLLINNAAVQVKMKETCHSTWYLPRPWWCKMHCPPDRLNLLLWFSVSVQYWRSHHTECSGTFLPEFFLY